MKSWGNQVKFTLFFVVISSLQKSLWVPQPCPSEGIQGCQITQIKVSTAICMLIRPVALPCSLLFFPFSKRWRPSLGTDGFGGAGVDASTWPQIYINIFWVDQLLIRKVIPAHTARVVQRLHMIRIARSSARFYGVAFLRQSVHGNENSWVLKMLHPQQVSYIPITCSAPCKWLVDDPDTNLYID